MSVFSKLIKTSNKDLVNYTLSFLNMSWKDIILSAILEQNGVFFKIYNHTIITNNWIKTLILPNDKCLITTSSTYEAVRVLFNNNNYYKFLQQINNLSILNIQTFYDNIIVLWLYELQFPHQSVHVWECDNCNEILGYIDRQCECYKCLCTETPCYETINNYQNTHFDQHHTQYGCRCNNYTASNRHGLYVTKYHVNDAIVKNPNIDIPEILELFCIDSDDINFPEEETYDIMYNELAEEWHDESDEEVYDDESVDLDDEPDEHRDAHTQLGHNNPFSGYNVVAGA